MAFSRVAYVCKCSTRIPDLDPEAPLAEGVRVRTGSEADLARLPAEIDPPGRRARLAERLALGEIFVVGEIGDRIVSCTWLRRGGVFTLHHLPDRPFRLALGIGYGYDAWTDPALRGRGIRRAVFAEELRILRRLGAAWEVSYFVDHQLEGGRRNLSRIGSSLIPLWKLTVRPGGVALKALFADDTVTPCFDYDTEAAHP